MKNGTFASRHIGPRAAQEQEMLAVSGVSTMEELVAKTIPANIRRKALDIKEAMTEQEYLEHIQGLGE